MQSRHSRGEIVRLYLDIVVAGVGEIGLSPTIAIQRRANGEWFQASDGTFVPTKVENPMTETSVANLPGRYHFDFDQSLDLITDSDEYIVRKSSAAGTIALEYEDLVFGPLAGAATLETCSVQGSISDAQGRPRENVIVRAVLEPVFKDGLARVVESDVAITTYTNGVGDFDLPLVRGGTFRLEIDAVGYDRKVIIPDQASVLFTDL